MRKTLIGAALLMAVLLMGLGAASAQAAKHSYEMEGPVIEVNDTSVVVRHAGRNWEIYREGSTQLEGDIRPGDRVRVEYTMTATHLEVKARKGKKK